MRTSWRRLEDVFKTSWSRRICSLSLTSSEDVFKMSWSRPIYSSWRYVFKTSSRYFQDALKTFSRRLQDVMQKRLQGIFKTSSRRFEDVLQRYLQDVFKMYHQVKLLWDISQNTQENICAWISFFDKVKLCRSAASLKNETLAQVLSFEFCKIRKNTFFENTTRRLLLIIAVSTVNYFRKRAPSHMFDWVENRLQAKDLKHWAHSCSQSSN